MEGSREVGLSPESWGLISTEILIVRVQSVTPRNLDLMLPKRFLLQNLVTKIEVLTFSFAKARILY